jgi:hypothetical protein
MSIMTIKTKPKFGNGDGNWSKMKDLLYIFLYLLYETNLIAFLNKIKKFIHACLQYFYFNKSNFLKLNYKVKIKFFFNI